MSFNAAVNARLAEDEARLLCTHENLYLFRDTDTGVVDGLCPDCGRMPEAIPTGIEIAETNAAMRSECSHTWGNWIYYNTTQHARICTKCSQLVYAAHTIVEADCVTFKHCTVCNGRDTSWQTPYGHILDWEFDDDGWIKSGYTVYKHARRCVRKDNDLEPICDYVVSVSDCDMSARYWEAAENGMHEVYYVPSRAKSTKQVTTWNAQPEGADSAICVTIPIRTDADRLPSAFLTSAPGCDRRWDAR